MKALAVRTQNETGFRSRILVLGGLMLVLSGCLTDGTGKEGDTSVVANPSTVPPPPLTSPERTICDPFNTGTSAADHGVVGNLLYLSDSQPRYTDVHDYMNFGTPVESTLYFDKIFIPTRPFDAGFYTQTGELVLNQDGLPLYEYFALRLESQLTLAPGEAPGYYQLATLADDGAILSLKNQDGSLTTLVDDNGTHPTQMACSNHAIYLDQTSKIPVVLEYYQGPRYHIAMTVMWRPLPDGADPNAAAVDVECGQSGNDRYFDSTQTPSAPSEIYYDMLTRGWKPLDNANYYFPEQASNPCATASPLLLTNFAINTTRRSVTVSWVTSIPASTQAQVKDVNTSQTTLSTLDSTLSTNHTVTLSGLTANTLYSVSGISVSADSQTTTSAELAFRTPR